MPSKQKPADLEVAFEILRSLRKILRKTSEHSRQISRHSGLSVPQLLVLKAIDEADHEKDITAAMISSAVHLSAPTVTRILDRLEVAQYVERTRHPNDRRKVCITLTDLGTARLESLPTPLHEQFLAKLRELDRTEKDNLRCALDQICEMMDADGYDASPVLTTDLKPE